MKAHFAHVHWGRVLLTDVLVIILFNPSLTNFLQGTYHGRLDLLVMVLGTFFLMVGSAASWATEGGRNHSYF